MKERKLLFTYYKNRKTVFSIEDNRLAQVFISGKTDFNVGDIFIGRVKNIVRGMDAAFVEFLQGTTGFLSYKNLKPEAVLNRKDGSQLKCGDELIVQISKEPLKTKDAALTTDLSLSGNYLVVFPYGSGIHYSNKLDANERQKIATTVSELISENDAMQRGYIFRTNAVNASRNELSGELNELIGKSDELLSFADKRTVFSTLYKEKDFFANVLKNMYHSDHTEIVTDKKEIFEQIQTLGFPVRFYEDDRIDMFRLFGLEDKLREAVSRKVWLKNGGYLIIEPTEALTVIDVNSGKTDKARNKLTPEEFHHHINMEAVPEILHQLRLRNISGIIIVDFLKTGNQSSQQLLNLLTSEAKKDYVQTVIIGMTKLGLVEITRKKTEASLYEKLSSAEDE